MSLRGESPSGFGAGASSAVKLASSSASAVGACYVLLVEQTGKTLQSIRSSVGGQRLHNDLSSERQSRSRNLCLPGFLFREAEEREVVDFFNPKRTKTTLVLKGFESTDLFISCLSTDDVERITFDEMCLLLGVPSPSERLRILRDKMLLEDLKQLQMGDNVLVLVSSNDELDGFLRYKGPISSQEPATVFGIELVNHPGQGNSDGTFQKRSYFQVAPNCAIFVGAHRVVAMHQSSPRRRGGAAGETASLRSSSKPKQRQIQQQQQQQQQTPLAIGERIVWMADNGAEFGTVRWIGVLEDVSEDWTVGVEFDNAVGTGTGKYQNEQLFRARMNHASLIPVLGLVKEADFLGTHSSATTTSTAAAAASSSSVMSSTGNECPVFSEIQLDLVADRISKHDWPVVAQCLGVPSTMLGDVSVITILKWWWQSGSQQSGATSRLALLVDALQRAGKYDFASEIKRSFLPDVLDASSSSPPDHVYSSSSQANAFAASVGLGGDREMVVNGWINDRSNGRASNDDQIVDPEDLRANEELMREQEMVLNQARQSYNNSLQRTRQQQQHRQSSPQQRESAAISSPIVDKGRYHQIPVNGARSSDEASRSPSSNVDSSSPGFGGGGAANGGGGSSSSMNPLYDLSTTGFVSATQVMDERERRNKELMSSSTAVAAASSSSSSGTPRSARQARGAAALTTTTPVSSLSASSNGGTTLNGAASPSRLLAEEISGAASDVGNGAGFNGAVMNDSDAGSHYLMDNGFLDRFNEMSASTMQSSSSASAAAASSSAAAAAASKLEVGSLVEVDLNPQPNQFGVIRWIGNIAKSDSRLCLAAGLEMDDEDNSYTDGTFRSDRLFSCAPNRALFIPLSKCKLDSRFQDVVDEAGAIDAEVDSDTNFGDVESPVVTGNFPPPAEVDLNLVSGNFKGIQGHHNSCYLDATLFSMFAFSSVFDQVLYRPPQTDDIPQYAEIQRVLKECIVNPLRRNFFVRADRTLQLRRLLDRLSDVDGMMGEEKDPEEFLRSLLEQTLKMEPLIKLTSDQKAYFYQIFVEKDDSLVVPTIQQLFEKSMFQSSLRFTQAPACLIIQMPRYGKDFKMFKRIIPSLELDISDVIENSPRECNVCRNPADYECRDCYRATSPPIPLRFTAYCDKCMADHQYREPGDSTPLHEDHVKLSIPAMFKKMRASAPQRRIPRISMELFAVLCINTSHYVAFVKAGGRKSFLRVQEMLASLNPESHHGSCNGFSQQQQQQQQHEEDGQWLFFDSMAGRVGLKSGYNIPRVIYVEDFNEWASDSKRPIIEDSIGNDRILPEHIARLLGDAYMCFYQDPYQIDAM